MQVWLAIFNMLTGPESRSKALASSARCSAALRLRPLLTDILMDQLPVLRDLRRVLDELMLGCMGTAREHISGCLILEQVSDILILLSACISPACSLHVVAAASSYHDCAPSMSYNLVLQDAPLMPNLASSDLSGPHAM